MLFFGDHGPISPAASHNSVYSGWLLAETQFLFKLSCVRQLGKQACRPEEEQNDDDDDDDDVDKVVTAGVMT